MISFKQYFFGLITLLAIGLPGCTDKWEEHNELTETVLSENILQQINANPDLSKFREYLVKTGYDQLLQSSKSFTVWAPTNQALASLDAAIVNDPAKLKSVIGNHISYQRYLNSNPATRIQMLSNKFLSWESSKLDGIAIESNAANKYSGNGVLHVVSTPILPRQNIAEYIFSTNVGSKQAGFIQSQDISIFVESLAVIESYDQVTGKPNYKPGTGFITRNSFYTKTVDIRREDSLYTMILLTDAAYDTEYNKISKYFVTSTADSTKNLTGLQLTKDLVFRGLILPENLPNTLTSLSGVTVPIDKNAIVQTVRTSNGIVYVMNKVDFQLQHKIPSIKIEGENFIGAERNLPDVTHRRFKTWASNLLDVRVVGHAVTSYWLSYRATGLYATKYKVYWRAVNDFQATAFSQRLSLKNLTSTSFPLKDVGINNFNEVLLGEYTADRYGFLNMFLIANAQNPLVLDYIRLEPVY